MIGLVRNYFADLGVAIGAGWNRFWFTPRDAAPLGIVRLLTGLMALYAVATFAPDLERWFTPDGMLPLSMVSAMYVGQWSFLDYVPPNLLWPAFAASLAVLALFTAGIGGRLVCVLAAVVTLSFFSRVPLVTGEFETILAILLIYLCVGRSSDAFSLTELWQRRKNRLAPPSAANTIALRLLQLHLAAVHLMMGFTQLSAPENVWWTGEGIWLAAMRDGFPLVDLSGLAEHPRVIAAWSHLILLYLLSFPVLVWNRWARPLMIAVGVIVWLSVAAATGWLMFSLAMLVGLVAYVDVVPLLEHRARPAAMPAAA